MKQLWTLLALGVAAASHAVTLIDDFTTPYTNSVQGGTWVDSHAATVLGGERDVQFAVTTNTFNQFSDLDIQGAGKAIMSNGFGMTSTFTLQYDRAGDEAGNTGPGKTLTNGGNGSALLAKGDNQLCITWLGNDLDVRVTAIARLSGNTLGSTSATRFANSGAGQMILGVTGLDQADSITVVFAGVENADFGVANLKAVPEPGSGLALALAGGWLIRRRRSR